MRSKWVKLSKGNIWMFVSFTLSKRIDSSHLWKIDFLWNCWKKRNLNRFTLSNILLNFSLRKFLSTFLKILLFKYDAIYNTWFLKNTLHSKVDSWKYLHLSTFQKTLKFGNAATNVSYIFNKTGRPLTQNSFSI